MIGDGMGPNQVAMARASKGSALHMEGMPYKGTSSTSNYFGEVTDSAAGGTALACGIKTKNGAVGITHDSEIVPNLRELFEDKGKKTGLISTVSITDATPAAFGSHVENRSNQSAIAEQFINDHNIDLIMGGGGKNFSADLRNTATQTKGYTLITSKTQMLSTNKTKLLGLFADGNFPYYHDGYTAEIPTLEEMTNKGIETLKSSNTGFFLMVEGGAIDLAGHEGNKNRNIGETLEFDKAVKAALDFAAQDGNTLVVVTADHETGGLKYKETTKEYYFTSGNHTGADVPVFAYGVGASNFKGAMINTDINYKIKKLYDLIPTTTSTKNTTTKSVPKSTSTTKKAPTSTFSNSSVSSTSKTDNISGESTENISTSSILGSSSNEVTSTQTSSAATTSNPKPKDNGIMIVIVIIAGVLVLGGGGFVVYKFVLKK